MGYFRTVGLAHSSGWWSPNLPSVLVEKENKTKDIKLKFEAHLNTIVFFF
jgi:hypothetical protein